MPFRAGQNAIERKHFQNLQHILIDREINGALQIFVLLKTYKLQKPKKVEKMAKNGGLTDIWSYKN